MATFLMRSSMATRSCIIAAALLAVATSATAREKHTTAPASHKPTCERASYPGDPICDVGDNAASLPTPTDRQGNRTREGGVAVTDDLRVKGRSDFNSNRYGGTQLYNPNLNPSPLQDGNGGGGIDYKF